MHGHNVYLVASSLLTVQGTYMLSASATKREIGRFQLLQIQFSYMYITCMIINSAKSYLGKTQPQQLRMEPVEERRNVQPLHSMRLIL